MEARTLSQDEITVELLNSIPGRPEFMRSWQTSAYRRLTCVAKSVNGPDRIAVCTIAREVDVLGVDRDPKQALALVAYANAVASVIEK